MKKLKESAFENANVYKDEKPKCLHKATFSFSQKLLLALYEKLTF